MKKSFTIKNNMAKHFKFIIIAALVISFFPIASPAISRAITPTEATKSSEVDLIKEKIASKVAQISKPVKSIVRGKVTETNKEEKSFILETPEKKYSVDYLTTTVFLWIRNDGSKLSLSFANLEINDELVIIGDLLKEENKIKATSIFGKAFDQLFYAKIESVNKNILTVKTLSSETEYSLTITPDIGIKTIAKNSLNPGNQEELTKDKKIIIKAIFKDAKKSILTPSSIIIQN